MGERPLRFAKLSPPVIAQLGQCGIRSCSQLLECAELRLAQHVPSLTVEEVRSLISTVARSVAPAPTSVLAMKKNLLTMQNAVPTGIGSLDSAFGSGIPAGCITEFVGRAGAGKTQMCLTIAVSAAGSITGNNGVLYLDTERKFSATRVLEIAKARHGRSYSGDSPGLEALCAETISRIHVFTLSTAKELAQQMSSIQDFVIEHHIGLIVVDSVAAIARQEFGLHSVVQRQNWLNRLSSQLKYLAETFSIPIVVTNQVTTRLGSRQAPSFIGVRTILTRVSDESSRALRAGDNGARPDLTLEPALGNTWAHSVNNRIMIRMGSDDGLGNGSFGADRGDGDNESSGANSCRGQRRSMRIIKSPVARQITIAAGIGPSGVVEWPERN